MTDLTQKVGAATLAIRKKAGRRTWCPHEPFEKQRAFLLLDCLEAGYGGAAGGGKSDALLMAALQRVDVPGYAAILFRRTYSDLALPGAIMSRSKEWLSNTAAVFSEKDKTWTFPSGATLTFGYMDTDADRFRYQSAEFQFIGFDELTQFPEKWYRYMFSRLRRRTDMPVPLRMRFATNPGGIGHDWVVRRFSDWLETKEGRLPDGVRRSYVKDADEKERSVPIGTPNSFERTFVFSKRTDNPHLDKEYDISLAQLDAGTRKQLDEGLWIRDGSGLVYKYVPKRNRVVLKPDFKTKYHVLGIDYGFNDSTAFCIFGWNENDPTVYLLASLKGKGFTPTDAAQMTLQLDNVYKFDAIVGDTGGLGKGYAEEARQRFAIPIEAAEKQNKRGYIELLNDAFVHKRLLIAEGTNEDLESELAELPWNDDRTLPEDGFEDHLCDAMLYGWRKCLGFVEKIPVEKKPPTPQEEEDEMEAADTDGLNRKDDWFSCDLLAELYL